MIILPAIDIKDGCCVRLRRGDFATAHKVAEDAVQTAAAFSTAGAALKRAVQRMNIFSWKSPGTAAFGWSLGAVSGICLRWNDIWKREFRV